MFNDCDIVTMICCGKKRQYGFICNMLDDLMIKGILIANYFQQPIWGYWCCSDYLNFVPKPSVMAKYKNIHLVAKLLVKEAHQSSFNNAFNNMNNISGIYCPDDIIEPIKSGARLDWLLCNPN